MLIVWDKGQAVTVPVQVGGKKIKGTLPFPWPSVISGERSGRSPSSQRQDVLELEKVQRRATR